ncbi:hypothetical protein L3X38_043678 [Prunus dulcis]|uniref:Uncharacterized protein n=1 Tax=Prunus dulcis TaxID=3755 RepID=A0AAD4UYV8_PRUDU|nr:hypothetical protein L3X38_043678 [Prunus dulcis]
MKIWYQSHSAVRCEYADEDVWPLKEVDSRGLLGAHWLQSHGNSEVKRVEARAIPGWVTHWEVARELLETKSNSKVKRVGGWSNPRMGDHPGKLLRELPETKPCGLWEAFWELTGFGFVGIPKLSELEAGAIPGWVTTLGSCFVSS